jgi:hypothetical protein
MEEERYFMYEDNFVPIFERMLKKTGQRKLKDLMKKKLVKEK